MDQRKSTGLVISCSAGVSTEHYSYDSWILESYLKLIEVQLLRLRASFHALPLFYLRAQSLRAYAVKNYAAVEIHLYLDPESLILTLWVNTFSCKVCHKEKLKRLVQNILSTFYRTSWMIKQAWVCKIESYGSQRFEYVHLQQIPLANV